MMSRLLSTRQGFQLCLPIRRDEGLVLPPIVNTFSQGALCLQPTDPDTEGQNCGSEQRVLHRPKETHEWKARRRTCANEQLQGLLGGDGAADLEALKAPEGHVHAACLPARILVRFQAARLGRLIRAANAEGEAATSHRAARPVVCTRTRRRRTKKARCVGHVRETRRANVAIARGQRVATRCMICRHTSSSCTKCFPRWLFEYCSRGTLEKRTIVCVLTTCIVVSFPTTRTVAQYAVRVIFEDEVAWARMAATIRSLIATKLEIGKFTICRRT